MDSQPKPAISRSPALAPLLLGMVIAIYAAVFVSLEYQRYFWLEFEETGDSAADIQILWSVLHGSFYTTTVQDFLKPVPHNVLGDQLCFTLLFYLPFRLLFSSPFGFSVVTVLISSLGAIPLYRLARDQLKSPAGGVLFAASYLFNLMNWGIYFRFGFRDEVLVIPFLFAAWRRLRREKYLQALIFLILVLLTKHNSILVVGCLGLYLLYRPGRARFFGLLCLALAGAYYFGAVRPLFDHFSASSTAYFKGLDQFGPTPAAAILNLIRHPGLFFQKLTPVQLKFLARSLFPVGFLCLLSPCFYIALPIILINILLGDYLSVYCAWHWALVVPFIYVGAVEAIGRLQVRAGERWRPRLKLAAMILAAAVFLVEASWVIEAVQAQKKFYYREHGVDTQKMIAALKVIPPEASVSTMYRMAWFLAERRQVYINHYQLHLDTDYVVVTLPLKIPGQRDLDRKLIPIIQDPGSPLYRDYTPVVEQPNLIIYRRLAK
jgi:uncharacterized membrane protein